MLKIFKYGTKIKMIGADDMEAIICEIRIQGIKEIILYRIMWWEEGHKIYEWLEEHEFKVCNGEKNGLKIGFNGKK